MKTALYDKHVALGAKIIDFAGWEMPIQYKGIIVEHKAVRNNVGVFDVSHMGRINIDGNDAESFLDYLSTNKIVGKQEGTVTYSVMCNAYGGCVDDVLIYKQSPSQFFLIVNASNRQKDLEHLLKYSSQYEVKITPLFESNGIIALQGPRAEQVLIEFVPEAQNLKPFHFLIHNGIVISRTGYTGAGGFELCGPSPQIVSWWDTFMNKGVEPIGLGARDTLRLEAGFALYGHEINDNINPLESVSAWTIKLENREFIGKESIEKLAVSSDKRSEYGIMLTDPGIAREGCEVYLNNNLIGIVTSGTYSPTLEKSIAIILVKGQLKSGDNVEVNIRQKKCRAEVVNIPFIRKLS